MGRIAKKTRSALHSPIAARVLWISLLLVHIPAVIAIASSISQGEGSISFWSLAGLAATICFFILKSLDVAFLRFQGRGTKIAFLLVCALVHRGVVTGPLVEQVIDSTPLIAAAGVASLAASSKLRRRLRDAIKFIQRTIGRTLAPLPMAVIDIVRYTLPKTDVPIYRLRQPSRGPPAYAL